MASMVNHLVRRPLFLLLFLLWEKIVHKWKSNLLRCQFAKYEITNAGSPKMLNFFWSFLLQNGEHDRVFRVIGSEAREPRTGMKRWDSAQCWCLSQEQPRLAACPSQASSLVAGPEEEGQGAGGGEGLHLRCAQKHQQQWAPAKKWSGIAAPEPNWRKISLSRSDTAEVMLTWHIATCILEVRHPYCHDTTAQGSSSISDQAHQIAATHLSRYCAYLMAWSPELLPDEDAWSKSLYKAVKEDAVRALAVAGPLVTPEVEYQELVQLLGEDSRHEVLKNGAKLATQLAELVVDGEETPWAMLAKFWAKMVLHAALSKNLRGIRWPSPAAASSSRSSGRCSSMPGS
ncbi:hypothetical protein C2845_PM03G22750 [Panicum miliaceum]|uniref:DUF4220 domain-containing protein n=1 Tax=Panicum miliaceum TaxID=4540 RepID=A0A3L6T651_PANMI|nr:hypothetical protein C2845_PM03G22750 [Panicum miliaceum]